jgi:hypothetical protein
MFVPFSSAQVPLKKKKISSEFGWLVLESSYVFNQMDGLPQRWLLVTSEGTGGHVGGIMKIFCIICLRV